MRQDSPTFALLNEAETKSTRFVIKIEFDVDSIYVTSHSGITGIPGEVIESVLQTPSAISQQVVPDEGRTTIGSFSFTLVDLNSQFTQAIQQRLQDYQGLRDHRVKFYVGYSNPGRIGEGGYGTGSYGSAGYGEGVEEELPDASFDEFQLFQTQEITGVKYKEGVYSISCQDITREQRQEIFEPKTTTLRASITESSVIVPVYVTSGFTPIQHGPSFSDAPNTFAGYILIEDEIIRYTAKTSDSFIGCTRGVFNTKAVAHEVDANTSSDRRQKVEEMIYLEMPAPMMAYAILTGTLKYASGDYGLPDHWNLGIDPSLVRLSDFTGIGEDLWDTTDDTQGFIPAFQELKKTDGKKFLESEIYQLIGCYPHIYYDGQLGLTRMNPVLIDAAGIVEINETNAVSWSDLVHDYSKLFNTIRVDWNYNGQEFTRTSIFVDGDSIDIHGKAPIKQLQFKGLRGWRHSDAVIRDRISAFRDRYTSPPETMQITVLPSLNRLEVGDIVSVKLDNVRDFAGDLISINRAFEIQKKSDNYATGSVTLDLFGSTGRASPDAENAGTSAVLPDAYYTSAGTELSTVCTISVVGGVGQIQAGSYTLAGDPDLNDSDAIYYYDGDLDLLNGATLVISDNVQLRVKGFFTVNGIIDGVGNGKSGIGDVNILDSQLKGTSGYIGNARGMDGVQVSYDSKHLATRQCALTVGQFSSFPYLTLEVSGNALKGLPSDLRGTSGGPGGKVARQGIVSLGGTGGNSGAGLAIICRGFAFGASGKIDLSGDDSAATSLVALSNVPDSYPGAGGAGGPGSLFMGLDGGDISIPDFGGKFFAVTGHVPINGHPIEKREYHRTNVGRPYAGFLDPALISDVDYSNVAQRIQYIPSIADPQEDQNARPATPTDVQVTGGIGANYIKVVVSSLEPNDSIEIYGSPTNDRTDAELIASSTDLVSHTQATGSTQYYWVRVRRTVDGPDVFSDWVPSSATEGVSSAPRAAGTDDIAAGAVAEVISSTVASQDVYTSGTTPILVTSVVLEPYDVATEITVTANGRVDHNLAAGTQASTFAKITDATTTATIASNDAVIARNPNTTDTRVQQSWFLERQFSVGPGVAKTFYLYGQGASVSSPGSQCLLLDVLLNVKVRKR